MKRIVLISCVSQKQTSRSLAKNLYVSPLFRLSLRYAQLLTPDGIFILSAKYGLVELDDDLDPYDQTLNTMKVQERKEWAAAVLAQLAKRADLKRDHFVFLAGDKYRKYLLAQLSFYEIPMRGLTIGRQLQFLKQDLNQVDL
ncbi:MAG: hypothetical protein R2940_13145 [Syntrophotaleaceae bacterium]